jgi:hypothetical protein
LALVPARFGFVELRQLFVKVADRRIGRVSRHSPTLRGAFQVERTIVLRAHCPSPLSGETASLPAKYHESMIIESRG